MTAAVTRREAGGVIRHGRTKQTPKAAGATTADGARRVAEETKAPAVSTGESAWNGDEEFRRFKNR